MTLVSIPFEPAPRSGLTGRSRSIAGGAARNTDTLDDALIARIAAGDATAMNVLYARHSAGIYRFVLRLTGERTAAEEVVHEVFIEAWRSAGKFEGRSRVSTWLLSIAHHKAVAVRRRRSAEPLDQETCELIEDTAENPEQALRRKQQGGVLRECLMRLSPSHREIVDLVYYHGKSIVEAAEIVGVSLNTVKTRMFYARKHLLQLLRAEGVVSAAA